MAQLRPRGIEVTQDSYGTQYSFSSLGLYWLFNVLCGRDSKGKKLRLTNDLLHAVANTPVDSDWRSLRLKAIKLPVYSEDGFQLAFYLNGTPPRMLQNTGFHKVIGEQIEFLERSSVLSVIGSNQAFLNLSEDECKQLMSGELLEINLNAKQ